MAITVSPITDVPPAEMLVRAEQILIHNGMMVHNEIDDACEWTRSPYAKVHLRGCVLMLDESGKPLKNSFNQPAYIDLPWHTTVVIEDAAKLAKHLANVWEPLMTAVYTEAMSVNLEWKKS